MKSRVPGRQRPSDPMGKGQWSPTPSPSRHGLALHDVLQTVPPAQLPHGRHVSPRPGPADASKVHLAWAVLGYTNWASKHAGLAASTSEPTQNPAASGAAGSAAGTATTAMEVGRGMGKAAGKLLRSPHLPAFHVPRSCCLRWLCIELCICCQLYITLCSVACFSLFHAMY